jgi:hypothetical protein
MPNVTTLRSFNIPMWMEKELKMLAFRENMNKTELMNRMIYHGLQDSWKSRPPYNEPRIIDSPVPERSDVTDDAKEAMQL